MRPSHHGRQKRKLPITVTFFLAKGQIIDGRVSVSRGAGIKKQHTINLSYQD